MAVAGCTAIMCVTALLALTQPWADDGPPTDAGELPALARAHGVDLGVAVAVEPLLWDGGYQDVVEGHYTSLTAENTMKWEHVQPERGVFEWSGPDTVVHFAESHGMDLRGHTLLWHNQQPSWLSEGVWTSAELREVLREHMEALMGRYQGRIGAWDVINEPFEDGGPFLRENLWYQVLGEDYIAEALWMAHEVDPEARLYINEFNIEGGGAKSDALYALASDLLDRGVPLHGIGFQSHFVHGQVPENLAETMTRFTDLGLEVTVTELDVRIAEPVSEEAIQEQREEFRHVVAACLDVSGCRGVTVWGVGDAHSWIPEWFPGYDAATPFDEDYEPKPALWGMVDALSREPSERSAGSRRRGTGRVPGGTRRRPVR
ncbi:endo-1,4-beta-xylanase [Nocardiopsis sp. NRRL B-16309]|uniref:endo-1,4-beta-xylanase n=1 Tax=Nocardiopsis sp. NRRL B-16309 TaxID=1519494 RepID=UPI0006ADB698|nr:endo-1,4-beta-xylanase [Nocardiopsis sp. NRRL B-16309]KOX07886.1 1,4-beta-xylanase [Nocardiopsis sp. NRRL B-16309]